MTTDIDQKKTVAIALGVLLLLAWGRLLFQIDDLAVMRAITLMDGAPYRDYAEVRDVADEIVSYGARETKAWANTFLGLPVGQYPGDLQTYQDLLHRVRPDVVVVAGAYDPGLTVYLSLVLEQLHPTARILVVGSKDDSAPPTGDQGTSFAQRLRARITAIDAPVAAAGAIEKIKGAIGPDQSVLVLLEASDTLVQPQVTLRSYAELVTPNSYLVVDDPRMRGPADRSLPGGPSLAMQFALGEGIARFALDHQYDRFTVTALRDGILQRVR